MVDGSTTASRIVCLNCGYETPAGSDAWATADHPSLGALTQCPECGSTNTTSREAGSPAAAPDRTTAFCRCRRFAVV